MSVSRTRHHRPRVAGRYGGGKPWFQTLQAIAQYSNAPGTAQATHPDSSDAAEPTARFVSQLTKNTYALMLAGGRGSRLMQLTDWRAKPAVPFGGKFRIIDFTLSNCVNSGIRRIGVATQYKAHSLIQHMQRGWSFLDGRFERIHRPAAGAAAAGRSTGTRAPPTRCSRTWTSCARNQPEVRADPGRRPRLQDGLRPDAGLHVEKQADMTVACIEVPVEEATAFGVMGVDDGLRVTRLRRKAGRIRQPIPGSPDTALASMGIYVFNAKFLYEQLIRDSRRPELQPRFRQGHHPPSGAALPRLRPPLRRQLRRHGRTPCPTGATSAPSMPTGRPTWS